MSILSVDQIQPIGSGTTITLNATEVKTGTEITVGTGASIFSPAGNTLTLGTNNVERLRITNDGTFTVQTGGSERLRIDSSGLIANNARVPSSFGSPNLLISGTNSTLTLMGDGSTNSSSFTGIKFRVAGTSAGDYTKAGIFSRREGGYNDLSIIFALNTDANANSVAISDEKLRITSSGRLGLGTNNPDSLLHVYGASVGYAKIETGDGGTNPIIMHKNPDRTWHAGLRGDTGDSYVIRDASASPAANRLIINTSGAFGLNGANYGTSGQVLTSQGSGSAVQWASPASNSPAFQAYLSGHYSPSSGSEVAVPFDTKTGTGFDTNNCYNTSTYKFTPNVAGNYVVYCSFFFQTSGGSNSIKSTYAKIEKNSAINIAQQWIDPNDSSKENRLGHSMTAASTMNGSSDFLIVKAYCLADHTPLLISSGSSFGAFKLA